MLIISLNRLNTFLLILIFYHFLYFILFQTDVSNKRISNFVHYRVIWKLFWNTKCCFTLSKLSLLNWSVVESINIILDCLSFVVGYSIFQFDPKSKLLQDLLLFQFVFFSFINQFVQIFTFLFCYNAVYWKIWHLRILFLINIIISVSNNITKVNSLPFSFLNFLNFLNQQIKFLLFFLWTT